MIRQLLLLLILFQLSFSVANFSNLSVNVTLSRNYTITDFEQYHSDFYTDWGGHILAIAAMGLSFIFSGNWSQAFLMTGIGWVFIGLVLGPEIFFIGGLFMFVASYVLKYMSG